MDKYPYFSIIIPVYNVEKYIDKCIYSVIEQEYKNFEIILVDDGSPDRCPEICDEYAKKDSRIRVIHKVNGGLSSARNCGINIATGEYILFLDSDDFWNSKKALMNLYDSLKNEDIDVLVYNNIERSCITNKEKVCDRIYDVGFMENASKEETLKYLLQNNLFPGAAWLTVTKRKMLINKKLYFIEGIKAEDIDWLIKVYLEADTFSAINEAFYVYLKYRNDSITGTADAKSIDDLLYTIGLWQNKLRDDSNKYIANDFNRLLGWHYACDLLVYNNLNRNQKKEYKKKLKVYKYMLKYPNNLLLRYARVLPITIISLLLNIYRSIKINR